MTEITLETVRKRAEADAGTYGYYLNPNPKFLQSLFEGLKRNEERYGYPSCPCRLASGKFEIDRDIICPCDYRDPDVAEFGACYCALYVRKDLYEGKTEIKPVPERRPLEKQSKAYNVATTAPESKPAPTAKEDDKALASKPKLWYCKQCGYVAFRDEPPYTCPICKAKKEMFAEIKTRIEFS
ncbi:ferredoxin:glutaredoxin reductase [Candidatus Bathyarchaeota archaeon]|nr:ferredoxin:glutaredoxin reductase [Candidatus Bathyarchaeota archaeon]